MDEIPTLVVVGRVNKGKSSIVAAFTEDAGVPIDRTPGTTRRAGAYELAVDGRVVLRLIDTPGFQEAPALLEHLRGRATSASERAAAIAEIAHDPEGARFLDEQELLRQLTGNVGIVYVVDASVGYRPAYEAEMELLRWTGRPAMALLNQKSSDDRSEEWRAPLLQFFHVVREFNAHEATLGDRVRILRAFGEVHEDWRDALENAARALETADEARLGDALREIAGGVLGSLSHVERCRVAPGADVRATDATLRRAFEDALRRNEEASRRRVQELHRHRDITVRDPHLAELLEGDLFAESTQRVFGLTKGQLIVRGALWGAAAGALIDMGVGGLSFGIGLVVGGVAGGTAAWIGSDKIARSWDSRAPVFRALFPGETGSFRGIGPVVDPEFAWVLVDRALVHLIAVRGRTHARRGELDVPSAARGSKAGVVHLLPRDVHGQIDKPLRAALKAAKRGDRPGDADRRALAGALRQALRELDAAT